MTNRQLKHALAQMSDEQLDANAVLSVPNVAASPGDGISCPVAEVNSDGQIVGQFLPPR